jgi:YD repeat-containing protein
MAATPTHPVTVKIGDLVFDHAAYDREGDVLYLHVGPPQAAADGDETPEGHAVRYDAAGRVIGLTLLNARWLLDREGAITVTLPRPPVRVGAAELAPALGPPG